MASAARPLRVLFLCTGNSCRSQMAEGWARALRRDSIEPYSAGTDPHGLNPLAVRAMAEAGVDISRHQSKRLDALAGIAFDVVVTVCDSAHESCPVLPGAPRVIHIGFDDPPRLARSAKSDDEALPHYRRVRDEIRQLVETLPQSISGGPTMSNRTCCDDSCCATTGRQQTSVLSFRTARPQDEGRIVALLHESGLPTSDIPGRPIAFTLAESGPAIHAVVGLEHHGKHALLRSLAVLPRERGHGLGRTLVSHALAQSKQRGVEVLYLLTTTAAPFFERLGFERADRAAVPDAIRNSTEFAGLCPSSATCMRQNLAATPDSETLRNHVRDGYAKIARAGACGAGGGCCGPTALTPDELAQAVGYTLDELASTPDAANMGLSCGNPTAIASLRPGEVVLDLGSGGGFDCFVAGRKVGPSGRVIGVDMTPDMLTKARRNITTYQQQTSLDNVEFRLGEIEALPVADASVDVVISNCVLNLSPDKPRVWREIARVLKPGGRVAVSDLALLRPLPDSVKADVEALVGCVAGAVLVEETRAMATAAGLADISITPKPQYIDAMTNWKDPLYRRILESLPPGSSPRDYITSLDVSARKP